MSTTTFDRGSQFGGDDGFEILQGGQIRWSLPIDEASVLTWLRGYVLELKADGTVDKDSSATNGLLKGLALERRSPVGGRPEEDETLGSKKASMLLDESIVRTIAVASGISVAVNDKMYPNGAGLLTNVDAGGAPVLGKALSSALGDGGAGGSGSTLTMFYSNHSVSS